MTKTSASEKIREYLKAHPTAKPAVIARDTDTSVKLVYTVRRNLKVKNKAKPTKLRGAISPKRFSRLVEDMTKPRVPENDPVNHPPHYKVGGIETIDFIEAKKLNYNLGNVVKYITRADHKNNRVEDLEKAMWYLKREISAA